MHVTGWPEIHQVLTSQFSLIAEFFSGQGEQWSKISNCHLSNIETGYDQSCIPLIAFVILLNWQWKKLKGEKDPPKMMRTDTKKLSNNKQKFSKSALKVIPFGKINFWLFWLKGNILNLFLADLISQLRSKIIGGCWCNRGQGWGWTPPHQQE